MVAYVSDPAATLLMHKRLIRRTGLKGVLTQQRHILGVGWMLSLRLLAAPDYRYGHKQKQENELFHRFVLSLALR
jgi:hypothetical protein